MATPRKIVVDVEPKVVPVQSRLQVRLLAQDSQTALILAKGSRTFTMSPRNFVIGQFFKVGVNYLRIQGVIHDPEDPAGVTLLVGLYTSSITMVSGHE